MPAALAQEAMQDERFRAYVQTRRHRCEVTGGDGMKRTVTWNNINQLLAIEGYDGETGWAIATPDADKWWPRRMVEWVYALVMSFADNPIKK